MATQVRHLGRGNEMRLARTSEAMFQMKCKALICALCCATLAACANQSDGLAIDQKSIVPNQEILLASAQNEQTLRNLRVSKVDLSRLAEKNESTSSKTRPDLRRPIWVLAHMVNSIKELEIRLAKGANAIESDVTFGRDGSPLYTYHGPPCDCWRHCYQQEEFGDFLDYVREISLDAPDGIGQNLSLLFLDLKLDALDQRAKMNAGRELAKAIRNHLFLEGQTDDSALGETRKMAPLNLILSVNHVQDIDLIHNFIHQLELTNSSHLMQRVGFDVGMNDELQLIETMWRRFGSSLKLWQGDGYTNCLSPFYNLERLTKALEKRDQPNGFPAKVYHWTIDLHDRMRESLRLGVDAIMTNHPERLLNVLREPELAHNYRLASRMDDPFRKLTRDSLGRSSGETARYERSASATNGGLLASLVDVFASWLNYVREIPFLSFPTTIVSPSSRSNNRRRIASQQQQVSNATMVNVRNQSPEYNVDIVAPYEGPKWYTTLASNMLVSMMKVFLPT